MVQQKTKRQSWVDFARGVAIILVLYRHVFEGIKNSGISVENYMFLEHFNIMFFSFRMPLFFIVSGIFLSASFAKRGLKKYVEVKARTILYPYFLWGALQITLQIIFSKYANSDRTAYDYLYLIYSPREIEQFWYLYALFNVSVLYVIFKYVLKLNVWQQVAIGIAMFYLSAFFHRESVNLGFLLDIFSNYIFIVMGDVIHKVMRNPKNIKLFESWKVSYTLLIPFLASQLYFLLTNMRHSEVTQYRFVEYYQPFIFFFIAVTGCAFVISICFLLQKRNSPAWLRVLGKHSLYIYVAHVIAFASIRSFIINVLDITNVPFLMITGILSGLLIPVILYKLSKRLHMEWIFSLEEKNHFEKSTLAVPNAGVIN